jgi:hypothetical protein
MDIGCANLVWSDLERALNEAQRNANKARVEQLEKEVAPH